VIIIGKGLGKRGQVLKGGIVSGHSAYGFFFATTVIFLTDNAPRLGDSRIARRDHRPEPLGGEDPLPVRGCLGAGVGVVVGLILFGLVPK